MHNKAGKQNKKKWVFSSNLILPDSIKVNVQQSLPFWIASFVVGLVAVGYTRLFSVSEHLLTIIMQWHAWMIFILAPLSFLVAWMIVQLFAPNARGSGIPQVMAAIELSSPKHDGKVGKLLSLRIMITKIASSLMMVFGGAAIGREGPTIQVASSIFHFINKLIPSSWSRVSTQSYILTGASAGLAAAFNTPLGGIVFAIEELAKVHIRYFRTALFSAVIIAGLTAQGLLGPYLYLGYPDVRFLAISIFVPLVLVAVLGGIAGSLMSKAILKLTRWKRHFSKWQNVCFVLGAGLLVASLAYFFDAEILGSGKDTMNTVLFTENKVSGANTVLMRMLGPVIAFNTGAAGGVFAPSLAAGASIGAFVSNLLHLSGANANILILSGMVGFLTGVTRTPFTSAILVLEMTDRHSVIFHLMIAAMISNIAALMIDRHSLYEQLKNDYVAQTISETELK